MSDLFRDFTKDAAFSQDRRFQTERLNAGLGFAGMIEHLYPELAVDFAAKIMLMGVRARYDRDQALGIILDCGEAAYRRDPQRTKRAILNAQIAVLNGPFETQQHLARLQYRLDPESQPGPWGIHDPARAWVDEYVSPARRRADRIERIRSLLTGPKP